MSDQLISSIVTILTAIIGVAILAVIVSPNARTSSVIGAASKGFAQDLGAALSPVTGGSLGITGGFAPADFSFN